LTLAAFTKEAINAPTGLTAAITSRGRNIRCKYTQQGNCLEYAAIDEARIKDPNPRQIQLLQASGGDSMGFLKKFAYFVEGTKI
jgi:histone-lysine N-methyltransferase SUV39H